MILLKVCGKCQKELPLSEFWKSITSKGGIYCWCKSCCREYRKTKQGVPLNIQIHKQILRLESLKINVLGIEDAAYIAGLMDGDGYIGVTRNHTGDPDRTSIYQLKIEICNNCIDVLQWLLITVGFGRVFKRSDSRASSWIMVASRSTDFIKQIHPYLKIKRLQAEVAMKFAETLIHGGYRTPLSQEIIEKREELRSNIVELNSRYRNNNQVITKI